MFLRRKNHVKCMVLGRWNFGFLGKFWGGRTIDFVWFRNMTYGVLGLSRFSRYGVSPKHAVNVTGHMALRGGLHTYNHIYIYMVYR